MTVSELIEELKKMPQDKKVIVAGCDCYDYATYLRIDAVLTNEEDVIIERGDRPNG